MFHKIPSTISHYKVRIPVGRGASSVVYQGLDTKTGEYVALKFVSREIFKHSLDLEHFEKELRALPFIHHKNIAKYKETIYTPDYIIVVMEMLEEIFPPQIFDQTAKPSILLRWSKELLEALNYLHSHGIAHLDVKPENIGFDYYMQVKLFDFGLCAFAPPSQKEITISDRCGTPLIAAPEIILQEDYDAKKADIWSFGVTMHILATHRFPFKGINENNFIRLTPDISKYIDIQVDGALGEVIRRALTFDPKKRPSAAELLNTSLFDDAEKIRYQISSPLSKTHKAHSTILSPSRCHPIRVPSIISPFTRQISQRAIRVC